MTQAGTGEFPRSWTAEILRTPPLIAPARQFVYPMQIAGEEDTLARGALRVLVRPEVGGQYLLTCALGFTSAAMPTGIYACPNPDQLCAVAGGYAYLSDTRNPVGCTLLPLKPVVAVHLLLEFDVIVFAGFHSLAAWGEDGLAWESARLSHEGLRITGIEAGHLHGLGWNMLTDKETPFAVDLRTGVHTGGSYG